MVSRKAFIGFVIISIILMGVSSWSLWERSVYKHLYEISEEARIDSHERERHAWQQVYQCREDFKQYTIQR